MPLAQLGRQVRRACQEQSVNKVRLESVVRLVKLALPVQVVYKV